jgi:hypothetical protein
MPDSVYWDIQAHNLWRCLKSTARAVYGIDAHVIDVEVDMYAGSARDFTMVGMPNIAVRGVASASSPL